MRPRSQAVLTSASSHSLVTLNSASSHPQALDHSHLVPEELDFFLVESLLRLLVQTLSPPSVEVIKVEETGVSPRLFVKLKSQTMHQLSNGAQRVFKSLLRHGVVNFYGSCHGLSQFLHLDTKCCIECFE